VIGGASSTRIEGRAGRSPGTDLEAARITPDFYEGERKCRLGEMSAMGVDGLAYIEGG
jgi:hypothetical protein